MFERSLHARHEKSAEYLGLSHENSKRQQEFAFVASIAGNSWFLDEAWVGEWLRQMLLEHRTEQRRGRALRRDDMPPPCEHYARYLVLLELLDRLERIPRVKVMDVVSCQLPYVRSTSIAYLISATRAPAS